MKRALERGGQKNTNPIVVTAQVAIPTSKQVSDYLLCKACEARFNTGGEKWIADNCWRVNNDFRLQTALKSASPIHAGTNGLSIYEASTAKGVDVNKLAYFAASVFWRAGAHQFGPVLGTTPRKLLLGPYEEEFRAFLLNKKPFPSGAVLFVTVSSETQQGTNEIILFPWLAKKQSGFNQYRFSIPGIAFQLFLGKSIPTNVKEGCLVHSPSNRIFLGPNDGPARDIWKLLSKADSKGRG